MSLAPLAGRLGPILLGTLLLSLLFMVTVPPGYGPDEPSHFGYVRDLARGRGFPVLGRAVDPNGPLYEAHQPPLYYLAAAPFYAAGLAAGGEHGAWIAVRGFTLLCGLATVAAVFALAVLLFPSDPEIAVGAGLFAGWLPSQASIFTVASNDPLTQLGFSVTLLLLARVLLGKRPASDALWIGMATGATFLTKASGLVLLVSAGGILGVARADGPRTSRARTMALYALGASVCVPWMIRNAVLYGDPLGWRAFVHYFLVVRPDSATPIGLARKMGVPYSPGWYWSQAVIGWAFRDSLGMWLLARPGHPVAFRIHLPPAAYALWGGLWVAAAAGAIKWAVGEWRNRSPGWKAAAASLGATLLLLLVAYARLNAVFFWAQSRYLFPAVGALALVWSVGLNAWVPRRHRMVLVLLLGAYLALNALIAGYVDLGGYFEAIS